MLPLLVSTLLGSMVKDMFNEIGIGAKTNRSLRATGASIPFQSSVPEKIVQECTGHRSLTALRLYERTTAKPNQQVQGRSHRYGWYGFNRTTFRGNNHIIRRRARQTGI